MARTVESDVVIIGAGISAAMAAEKLSEHDRRDASRSSRRAARSSIFDERFRQARTVSEVPREPMAR